LATSCGACLPGFYSAVSNATSCVSCDPGMEQPQIGDTASCHCPSCVR
jgi:hypothetical protein